MDRHKNASYAGAIVTVFTSLTLSDWGVIAGILFGLCTVLINWYYKDREIKIKEKALEKYHQPHQIKDVINDENQ